MPQYTFTYIDDTDIELVYTVEYEIDEDDIELNDGRSIKESYVRIDDIISVEIVFAGISIDITDKVKNEVLIYKDKSKRIYGYLSDYLNNLGVDLFTSGE